MHAAQGRNPTDAIITELGLEVSRASCTGCARRALEDNRDNPRGPLTVPTFRAAMISLRNSTLHIDHIGHSDVDVLAGRLEGFWRGPAATAISTRLKIDRESAQVIAADLWTQKHDYTWHEDAAQAAEDCVEVYGAKETAATFVRAAVDRIALAGGPTRELVEQSFEYARRAFAAGGVEHLWTEAAS